MFVCKHCSQKFEGLSTANKANHSRWCDKNPKRKQYVDRLKNARASIKTPRNQYIKAKDEGRIITCPLKDKPLNRTDYRHSTETIEIIRKKALSSTHRRLTRSMRPYTKTDGTVVMLESSWEEALARRLDELMIQWNRPENPIRWIDTKGKGHHYFPDFYLTEYDIFLDPKNPQAFKVQKEKLDILRVQLPNLKILHSLDECKNFSIPARRTS